MTQEPKTPFLGCEFTLITEIAPDLKIVDVKF